MGIPLKQTLTVATYIMKQQLLGRKRYPLVLMLEPLFRCNLECAGCGKIQYPEEILKKRLSPQECEDAVIECGAPVVSIAGGEPLIHPEIVEIAERITRRKKFVYLCTNAILIEKMLPQFKPNSYFTFNIHMDGLETLHDRSVCRKGVFQKAVAGIRAAKAAGFRVTTNTTVFEGTRPEEIRALFDFLAREVEVDGMTVSPGYPYHKAPDQEHFLIRRRTKEMFREILKDDPGWNFNHSPLYLEFLMGLREYQCTAWGNPTRNIFGWQKPCYLMADGYARTFQELIDETEWERYGTGRDPRCADCMAHCGYEPSAVNEAVRSPRAGWKALVYALRKKPVPTTRGPAEEKGGDAALPGAAPPEPAVAVAPEA